MSQNRWLRPDLSDATPSQENTPSSHATAFFSGDDLKQVTQVAETLAAHGGGALSTELALDLVLHSLVEQARNESGASGAAIALIRDGEMVCRATTGETAPDLGVRVETGSSLAGACLQTGQMQQCRDTDADSRVNAEACRRLGVRSMVIAPLVDEGQVFGILQAFSAWPNAFGEREISALQLLTKRIAESKKAAGSQAALASAAKPEPASVPEATHPKAEATAKETIAVERPAATSGPVYLPIDEPKKPRSNEVWSSFLVILVIAAAVLLGAVVGWHGAANVHMGGSAPLSIPATPAADTSNNAVSPEQSASPPSAASTESSPTPPVSEAKPPSSTNAMPASGGLVISENGRIIYRTPSQPGTAPSRPSGTRLIHRVEPEYPPEAKAQNLQGAVVLVVQINGDGTVGDIGVTSGNPVLAKAAVDAVKQWKYQAYFVNGRAAESQAQITVRFKLPPS